MPKTVKLTRPWPYSLTGNVVLHGQPGDVLTLPDELAAAAIAHGALETKLAPAPEGTKAAPAADEDEDDTEEETTGTEPGNDGKTVPPAVVPPKRKRNR